MPTTAAERQKNLERLSAELQGHANERQQAFDPIEATSELSQKLFLAHSRSRESFTLICRDRWLSSREKLEAERKIEPKPDCAEVALGTQGDVFFYVAPFRYPNTACGILFAHTIESCYLDTAKATPFDSGALHQKLVRPDPNEPVTRFLARHEIPPVGHRRYLSHSLTVLFRDPGDYLDGIDPAYPSPIGLTGGDARAWTHEVRLPDQVRLLGNPHLQALFYKAELVNDPDVEAVLSWCQKEGIDCIALPPADEGDFQVLQRSCREYLMKKL
jgi:hypothetical protein